MKDFVFVTLGGLGFFFFGMKLLSDGLKKVAGEKLKSFLHNATKTPVLGILVGAFVTALIQSSSATTVMVVGFLNAGLLALKQGIYIIMGANIGTTVTAWIVSFVAVFKVSAYADPMVGVGFFIMILSKKRKNQSLGQVILGFGLLFIGLEYMKDAFSPLKNNELAHNIIIHFSQNPWLGAFTGMVFTFLIQSSSASIAIVQMLAFNGLISFEAAIPLILGGNIGTTITAQLAAIGTNINARRSAMSHSLFNVIGVLYMLILISSGLFDKLITKIAPGGIDKENIMFMIAISHTAFNVINTIVLYPFINFLEKASIWLVPKKEDTVDFGTQYLETHLLDTPPLALEQIHKEIIYMLSIAKKAVDNAEQSLLESDLNKVNKVSDLETVTDNLQSEITQYIVELSQKTLAVEESREIPVLIHNVNDLERIGDHSQNISELVRRKIEDNLTFSETANKELKHLWQQINIMFEKTKDALENANEKSAMQALQIEGAINKLRDEFKKAHIGRLSDGTCSLAAGFIFVEILDNLEKVADRLTNVCQSVLGKMQWKVIKKETFKV